MKTLEKAVIEQYGTREEFLEAIPDIMQGGASAGVSGFIYYHETLDFTKKHFDLIIQALKDDAESFGLGLLEMLRGFRCFEGMSEDEIASGLYDPKSEDRTSVYNGLAWYALESVAWSLGDK